MKFGECVECGDYRMLSKQNRICQSCQDGVGNRENFYEKGIERSQESVDSDDLKLWFDETVPFSNFDIISRKWLLRPYCYCTVTYSEQNDKYWYIIREPNTTKIEDLVLKSIRKKVRTIYESNPIVKGEYESLTKKRIKLIEDSIGTAKEKYGIELSSNSFKKLKYYLCRDIVLFDEVTGPMMDPEVDEVVYTSNMEFVTINHSEYGRIPTTALFSNDKIDKFSRRIADRAGSSLDSTNPKVGGEMKDGTKITVQLFGDFSPYNGKIEMDTLESKSIDF